MVPQVLVNGIISGSVYLLLALGFSLILSSARFFHFAHGIVFTAGAYFTYVFAVWLAYPLIPSLLVAIGLCVGLGCLLEMFVYAPLRRRHASSLVLMLVSLGCYILLHNTISLVFGEGTKTLFPGAVERGLGFFGARITPIQVGSCLVSLVLSLATALALKTTRVGKVLRAVASDQILAAVCGVGVDRAILCTFAFGSALAGMAGILLALDVSMTPTMGMRALMMAVVATIVGGVGSISGAALGALLLGLAQHVGAWKLGSQWQDTIAFFILIVFLLVRPQGVMGKGLRKATM